MIDSQFTNIKDKNLALQGLHETTDALLKNNFFRNCLIKTKTRVLDTHQNMEINTINVFIIEDFLKLDHDICMQLLSYDDIRNVCKSFYPVFLEIIEKEYFGNKNAAYRAILIDVMLKTAQLLGSHEKILIRILTQLINNCDLETLCTLLEDKELKRLCTQKLLDLLNKNLSNHAQANPNKAAMLINMLNYDKKQLEALLIELIKLKNTKYNTLKQAIEKILSGQEPQNTDTEFSFLDL